ncbi:V-type proton ATPase subunit G 1-like [Talpa occidentalis]|uniref:V-type proton ATPase subunit G 1-like n=1 Tax=Talpa occidentalis TaxID=50954 RepID=UPI00188F11A4|nr:V-type proton ATPase subunit G 1-like [Talpa occidentalis]
MKVKYEGEYIQQGIKNVEPGFSPNIQICSLRMRILKGSSSVPTHLCLCKCFSPPSSSLYKAAEAAALLRLSPVTVQAFLVAYLGLTVTAAKASQSHGIQQLLQAEKRAAEVSEARKRRTRRRKQAKEAAQAEIEQHRLQREKEFKAKEAAALGSHGSCSTEVEKETQEKMTILQTYFLPNRDEEVLDNLLAFVCDIQPEIHQNYLIHG